MPEEEPTAVAEPEVPEAPTPPEPPEPVPEAQEPESDADAAGESDETREGEAPESESGTPPDEGDGSPDNPIDVLAEQLEALYERDPDAADRIAKGLPQKVKEQLQGSDEIRAQLEAENAQGNRQGVVRSQKQVADSYNSSSFQSQMQPYINQMADAANEAAKKLDGREEAVLDGAAWGPHVSGNLSTYITGAKNAADQAARIEVTSILMDAFESHPSAERITAQDRKAMNAAEGKPLADQLKAYVHTLLDVAERNAPEAFTVKKTKELEDKLGIGEIIKSIADVAVGNGRQATQTSTKASAQPKDEQEARAWHASGKWENNQMRAYLARR